MAKKNQVTEVKNIECLNCGYPFQGYEDFCPNCGQKNQKDALSFKNFMSEVFQGFTSWDAKFWKTIVPLLTKPGKVSRDYIEGKRSRYTNPFRFYITTSIILFLVISLNNTIKDYQNLTKTATPEESILDQKTDSIKSEIFLKQNEGLFKFGITKINDSINPTKDSFDYLANFKIKNPNLSTDQALEKIGLEKNLKNRFRYSRAGVFYSLTNKEGVKKFTREMLSRTSIALFIMLPLLAFFLKLLYIRKKYNYIEHLIFIFHTQTVLFLLLTLYYFINCFLSNQFMNNQVPKITLLIFLIYLFVAMKKFYNQSYLKTFIKYILANSFYIVLGTLGTLAIMTITFVMI